MNSTDGVPPIDTSGIKTAASPGFLSPSFEILLSCLFFSFSITLSLFSSPKNSFHRNSSSFIAKFVDDSIDIVMLLFCSSGDPFLNIGWLPMAG